MCSWRLVNKMAVARKEHRMIPTLRRFAYIATLLSVAVSHGRAQGKPIAITNMIVDYAERPTALGPAVASASAVVVGRIRDMRNYLPPQNGATVRTMYTLDVAEVIHSEWPLSQSINVFRYGGDIDEGVRVKRIVESDFPAFMPGREYVMFLLWNNILNGFELKFGADSAYEVMPNGTITTHGRSRLAHAQSGRSAAAMIADLKKEAVGR